MVLFSNPCSSAGLELVLSNNLCSSAGLGRWTSAATAVAVATAVSGFYYIWALYMGMSLGRANHHFHHRFSFVFGNQGKGEQLEPQCHPGQACRHPEARSKRTQQKWKSPLSVRYQYDHHYHHHRHHPHVHDFCVKGFRVASTVLAASAAISYNFTSIVKALMQQRHQRQQCRWQQGSQQQQRASENLARCWSACALILSCPKSAFNIGVQRLR